MRPIQIFMPQLCCVSATHPEDDDHNTNNVFCQDASVCKATPKKTRKNININRNMCMWEKGHFIENQLFNYYHSKSWVWNACLSIQCEMTQPSTSFVV